MDTPRKILWDEEETAILIHAYAQFNNGLLFRNEAIKKVSKALRERAEQKGMEIDPTFRNENGITMQMTKIEDLFSGGKHRLSPPPQVFVDVANLYKKNRTEFDALLQRATSTEAHSTPLEEDFFRWLSKKIPHNLLEKFKNVYHDLDQFFSSYKVLDIALFDPRIINVIGKVKSAVISNKILHLIHQTEMPLIQTAVEFYDIYLNEYQHVNAEEHLPTRDACTEPEPRALSPSNTVDLSEITIEQYANTRPENLYYLNNIYSADRWNELYTLLTRCLYENYPHIIKNMIGKSLFGEGKRMDIGDESLKPKMKFPKEIRAGLYLETNLSATNSIRKIKCLLDLCGVDYSKVTITYAPASKDCFDDAEEPSVPENQDIPTNPPPDAAEMPYTPKSKPPLLAEETIEAAPLSSVTAYAFAEVPRASYAQTDRIVLPRIFLHLDELHSGLIHHSYSASHANEEGHFL